MNTNFKVIGLTGPEIKPESTAPETDALTTRSSELLLITLRVNYATHVGLLKLCYVILLLHRRTPTQPSIFVEYVSAKENFICKTKIPRGNSLLCSVCCSCKANFNTLKIIYII